MHLLRSKQVSGNWRLRANSHCAGFIHRRVYNIPDFEKRNHINPVRPGMVLDYIYDRQSHSCKHYN